MDILEAVFIEEMKLKQVALAPLDKPDTYYYKIINRNVFNENFLKQL